MRQFSKAGWSVFLSFLLVAPYELLAQGPRDPHTIFRFNEIPSPDYYSREFALVGTRPARDTTSIDSDQIIRDDPQSQRGFQAHWLRSDQTVAAVNKPTIATCIGGSGEAVRLTLKPGEAVVYDTANQNILSVVRCANKCIEGNIELPEPKTVEVEKPVYIPKPEFQVVEKPVFIERPSCVSCNKKETGKKRGWLLPLVIGGVGAGVVTAILLTRDRHVVPIKTYPSQRVISPP